MRKLLLLILLVISINVCSAHTFLYFRYDIPVNNHTLLKEKIESLSKSTKQSILYFENKEYQNEGIDKLLRRKSFLSNTSIYEALVEEQKLNVLFGELFDERIENGKIIGKNDTQWDLVFLLHKESSFDEIYRLIDINNLQKRDIRTIFIVYDDDVNFDEFSLKDIANEQLFLKF